jgi:Ca2+-binding EF-hand superfamily protein
MEAASQSADSSQSGNDDVQSLAFSESTQTDDFKMKVCLPYFKDIFKDLCGRSDNKSKGINKVSFMDYC